MLKYIWIPNKRPLSCKSRVGCYSALTGVPADLQARSVWSRWPSRMGRVSSSSCVTQQAAGTRARTDKSSNHSPTHHTVKPLFNNMYLSISNLYFSFCKSFRYCIEISSVSCILYKYKFWLLNSELHILINSNIWWLF